MKKKALVYVSSESELSADTLMEGYNADDEEAYCSISSTDERDDVWSDQEYPVFPSTYRKRSRCAITPSPWEQQQASLFALSNLLVNSTIGMTASADVVKKPKTTLSHTTTALSFEKEPQKDYTLPNVSFQPHITLQDALALTRHARILIQAEPPYAVVHANAAYARLAGSNAKAATPPPPPPPPQRQDKPLLMNVIQHYFGKDVLATNHHVTLTLYPVWGNVVIAKQHFPVVTHYLVEAIVKDHDESSSLKTPITSNAANQQTNACPVNQQPAQAVG